MHKKAAISALGLSINAIVILILAITMLGLGLTFIRNIFGTATQEFKEVKGAIHKQMIDQMKEENKEIYLSSMIYDIEVGEQKQIYIGFKNTYNEKKKFTISWARSNSLTANNDNCGLDEDENNVIIEYKQTPTTVQPGKTVVLPINIKTNSNAEKDSCFYEILVDVEGKDNTPVYTDTDGLVGYWDFNDGTADDSSGNNNDGTINGAVSVTSGYAKAMDFNGFDDYIEIPNSATLEDITESDYTFSAWYYPKRLPEDILQHDHHMILGKKGYHTSLDFTKSGFFYFEFWNSSNYHFTTVSVDTYEIAQWYHLTGTINETSKTAKLYINGELITTAPYNGALKDYGAENLRIGVGNDPGIVYDFMANGTIDEVRVYNRALSDSEAELLAKGYDSSIQLTVNVG